MMKTTAARKKRPAAKKARKTNKVERPASKPKTRPAGKAIRKKSKTGSSGSTRLKKILAALDQRYPKAECALHHANPFQLLVATILSAQCTDARVNKVTPELFEKYPTARKFARLDQKVLEQDIRSTGFFRNKARNIIGASKTIVEKFGGEVPRSMEQLLTLPGVARKTANVVLGTGYQKAEGVVVDTHVLRISRRLKLSKAKTPENVEKDLIALLAKDHWISFSHQIILFGREICQARNPNCAQCPIETLCDSPDKTV